MEIIGQKRKIYDHICRSFGAKLKIKTLKDLINVKSFPKADREIISLLLASNLITGTDETRIDKNVLLQNITDLTQGFIISEESTYRDYGIENVGIKGGSKHVNSIMAILPKEMTDQIARGMIAPHGGNLMHYEIRKLKDFAITIKVEKENDVNKIYASNGTVKKLIGVTDQNISEEQFARGGIFEDSFRAVPICHIRYVIKETKIFLVETQSDLIQKKARIETFITTLQAKAGTMMELNKLYFEETLKIDTFDLAIGLLKLKFPNRKILTTSDVTQTLIEGWSHKTVKIDFDDVKKTLQEGNMTTEGLFRSVSNKYELHKLSQGRGVVETKNIENEQDRKKYKSELCKKAKTKTEQNRWDRHCVLYSYDMDKIFLIKGSYVIDIKKTIPTSNHPEIKRIEERKKKYKLKTVFATGIGEPWYTSDNIQEKQEYIYQIAA